MEPIEIITLILFLLVGLFLGSFSNVLVYRLSEHKSLLNPSRSYCPKCETPIKWYDNIPILSFLILGGKCRKCKEKISPRYLILEVVGLVVGASFFLMNYWNPSNFDNLQFSFKFIFNWRTIIYFLMTMILINIALIDFKTFEIPFELSIPLMILCAGLYVGNCIEAKDYLLVNVLGFVIPLVFFGLIVYLIPYLIKKVEVIGLGDVILYTILGLAFGGWYLMIIVLISTLVCSIVELIKMKVTGEKGIIAFGPYIALATIICMAIHPLINQLFQSIGFPGV